MGVIDELLNLLKRIGIPLVVVFIIIAVIVMYRNYLEIQLIKLQISKLKRDVDIPNASLQQTQVGTRTY